MQNIRSLSITCIFLSLLHGCGGDNENTENIEPDDEDIGIELPTGEDALSPVDLLCGDTPESISNCARYARELFESLESHHYLSEEATKVNIAGSYPSDISPEKYIEVYINNGHEEYLQVDPDNEYSGVELNQGATIIREVWSEDNRIDSYTVMIKMETGFFPEGGDFLYAVLAPDMSVTQGGRLESCAQCHLGRENDGFLFGVREALKQATTIAESTDDHLANLARTVVTEKTYLENTEFFPVNISRYVSELNADNYLKVYISQFASLNYLTVHRDRTGSNAHVPEEAVIVREVQDISGNIKAITVMVKGPVGYYPEGGDFFYGVYDPEGNVVVTDGAIQEGRLDNCGSCHNALRSNDGFLFGVSSEDRN